MSAYIDRLEMNLKFQFANLQARHDRQEHPDYYDSCGDDSISEDQAELLRELRVERILDARESRERGDLWN